MLSPRDWSLTTKLAVAVLLLALGPLVVVALLNARETASQSVDREVAGLQRQTAQAAARLEERVGRLQAYVEHVATDPVLNAALEDRPITPQSRIVAAAGEWDERHPEVHTLLRSVRTANRWFKNVYLLNDKGVCIASSELDTTPPMVGRVYEYRPYFRAPTASGRPFVSDVLKNATSPGTGIFVSAPIKVGGHIEAVAVIKVDTHALHGVIAEISQAHSRTLLLDRFGVVVSEAHDGNSFAVDQPGTLQFHPLGDVKRFVGRFEETKRYGDPDGVNYLERVAEPLQLDSLWSQLKAGGAGAAEYPFPREFAGPSVQTMVGYSEISSQEEEPYGYLVIAEPAGEFREPLEALTRRSLIRFAVVVGGVALVLLLLIRTLGRRMSRLAEASRGVSAGDFTQRVRDDRGDELGRAAKAFDSMASKLGTTVASLKDEREEAEKARAAAEKANEARAAFMAGVAGRLRAPIDQVLGAADQLARRAEATDPSLVDDLQAIRRAADGVLDRADEILALSAADPTTVTLAPEDFQLRALLDEVADRVRPEARLQETSVSVEVPPDFGTFHGDRRRLRHIILNLAQNACQYTRKGSVVIRGARDGDAVVVSVEDSGIGLTRGEVDRLFDPLADLDQSDDAGARGLGLRISKRLVEMLGGTIEVESEPGKGSTFTMRIPPAG